MRRCLFCESPLVGKRRQAIYCDDLCGRAYRATHVYMSDAAGAFWKGVRSVSRRGRRLAWTRGRQLERLVSR